MIVPSVFGKPRALPVDALSALAPATLAMDDGFPNPLPLAIEHQHQNNWCWAAVAMGLARYFGIGGIESEQCRFVTRHLNMGPPQDRCCATGRGGPCDQLHFLHLVLNPLRCYVPPRRGVLAFEDIQREIGAGLPIGIRIEWNSGLGHFMTISGWDMAGGERWVTVNDPTFGTSVRIRYETLRTSYGTDGGEWTDSYLTRRPPNAAPADDAAEPDPFGAAGG